MKKVFILLFLLICTGCSSIKYELNFGETVYENINVVDYTHIHEEELEEGYMGDMAAFEFFFQSLPYRSSSDGNGNYYAFKEFNSIESYLDQSFVYDKFITSDNIKINGSKVKINIKTNDELKQYMKDADVDSLEISLYVPYYVSKHNADIVKDSTYTWKFDDLDKANLKINFDMSKDSNHQSIIPTILVVILLVVVVGFSIKYFIEKNKEVNEI